MAANLVADSWIMTVLTATSPVADGSFFAQKEMGNDVFCGIASLRCSMLGYWNDFTPVLDYSGTDAYAESIQRYVDCGLISVPSELYYPIRLKPKGENTLAALRSNGVNHIELRMIDLNPLRPEGIDLRDVVFAQLLTIDWQRQKIDAPSNYRYADIVRERFANGVVAKLMDNFRKEGGGHV